MSWYLIATLIFEADGYRGLEQKTRTEYKRSDMIEGAQKQWLQGNQPGRGWPQSRTP